MSKPRVKKLGLGTYRVIFQGKDPLIVTLPTAWIEILLHESELRSCAVEEAEKELQYRETSKS